MKVANAHLVSLTPISFGKVLESEKMEKETHNDYEARVWRERSHVNKDGFVIIPPNMFKESIYIAASMLSIQIPGKGKATYTKHFKAGVLVFEPVVLPYKRDDLPYDYVHAMAQPSNPGRGGRVWKYFPRVDNWEGDIQYTIVDDTITESVFERVLRECGQFVGLGRWRAANGGLYGRYHVESLEFAEYTP